MGHARALDALNLADAAALRMAGKKDEARQMLRGMAWVREYLGHDGWRLPA